MYEDNDETRAYDRRRRRLGASLAATCIVAAGVGEVIIDRVLFHGVITDSLIAEGRQVPDEVAHFVRYIISKL